IFDPPLIVIKNHKVFISQYCDLFLNMICFHQNNYDEKSYEYWKKITDVFIKDKIKDANYIKYTIDEWQKLDKKEKTKFKIKILLLKYDDEIGTWTKIWVDNLFSLRKNK
ncbi:6029_t:CDS:2, partial [Scutellospora calospora]